MFVIARIEVSKFEFASVRVVREFESLEEARSVFDSDPSWSAEVGGWNDGYTHRVLERLEDGGFRHPDGRPFAPRQGEIILGWL